MTLTPAQRKTAEEVLVNLVATPSVSGEEGAAVGVFIRHAHALGFDAQIDEAGNALAHRGPSDAMTHIVLLGHIDTVPGHISVRVADGVLHGRGSVDAKGPLAAMLIAASRAVLPDGVRLTVAGAVGEEAGSPGARFIADQYRPDACIIGEPSGWEGVTLGYKGRLLARVTSKKACAHSAGPGLSACDEIHAWWGDVLSTVGVLNRNRDRSFDQIQAGILSASSKDDGLFQLASLQASFRLPPGLVLAEFRQTLHDLSDHQVQIVTEGGEVAAVSDRNDPVVRAISAAIRSCGGRPRPKQKTGTADFNVVAPIWRCPIAAYGPGDSSLDHTPKEHLDLDEYSRTILVLSAALESLATELHGDPLPASTVETVDQ